VVSNCCNQMAITLKTPAKSLSNSSEEERDCGVRYCSLNCG